MSLANQRMRDGRTLGTTLNSLIAEHMPSAAVASGWVSEVDITPLVDAACAAHGWKAVGEWAVAVAGRPADMALGMAGVRAYCEAHGLPTGDTFVKRFRHRLIMTALRDEASRGD